MMRVVYLAALAILQVMLAWQLVPTVALVLQEHIRLGTLPDGWPSILQVAAAAVCVVGAGLTLGYPSVALMRHAQRGAQRFAGLPAWTVLLTFAGIVLLAGDAALRAFAYAADVPQAARLIAAALPLAPTGVALLSAGVLMGEILRRNRPVRSRSIVVIPPATTGAAERPAWRSAA